MSWLISMAWTTERAIRAFSSGKPPSRMRPANAASSSASGVVRIDLVFGGLGGGEIVLGHPRQRARLIDADRRGQLVQLDDPAVERDARRAPPLRGDPAALDMAGHAAVEAQEHLRLRGRAAAIGALGVARGNRHAGPRRRSHWRCRARRGRAARCWSGCGRCRAGARRNGAPGGPTPQTSFFTSRMPGLNKVVWPVMATSPRARASDGHVVAGRRGHRERLGDEARSCRRRAGPGRKPAWVSFGVVMTQAWIEASSRMASSDGRGLGLRQAAAVMVVVGALQGEIGQGARLVGEGACPRGQGR